MKNTDKFWYWLSLIVIGLVAILWLASLSGCSTTKKNAKAVSRVLSNDELFNRVGRRWEQANPCVNDSAAKLSEGKEEISFDTSFHWEEGMTDSLIKANPGKFKTAKIDDEGNIVFPENNSKTDSLIKYVPVKVYITKTVKKTDTLKIIVSDTRRENLLKQDIATEEGKVEILRADKKELKKEKKSLWVWLIGSNALWLLIGFLVWKFKK